GMPGAPPDALERLAARVDLTAAPSDLVRRGLGAPEMLATVLGELPGRVLEERAVRFRCRCSAERVRAAILAMGRDEIAALIAEERPAEAVCEFCSTTYTVDQTELGALLAAQRDGHAPDA